MPGSSASRMRPVLVVTGLNREAAMAAGDGIVTAAGGGDAAALTTKLAELAPNSLAGVISFGLAGALDPSLAVGDIVIATRVLDRSGGRTATDGTLRALWHGRLQTIGLRTSEVDLVGVDQPVMTPADKSTLRISAGAGAVDMESHVAAAFASARGLPFGVLRVVSDASSRTLPPLAARAMRPDGSIDVWRVITELARQPGQIAPLIATARDAAVAFRQLRRVRRLLGFRLAFDL